jgi:hypothetical protein
MQEQHTLITLTVSYIMHEQHILITWTVSYMMQEQHTMYPYHMNGVGMLFLHDIGHRSCDKGTLYVVPA